MTHRYRVDDGGLKLPVLPPLLPVSEDDAEGEESDEVGVGSVEDMLCRGDAIRRCRLSA